MNYIQSIILIASTTCMTTQAQNTAPTEAKNIQGNEALAYAKLSTSTKPVPRADAWWQQMHQQIVNEAGSNSKDRQLVFIGDSITHGWAGAGKKLWDENFAEWNALNLGIGGDATQHVLWRLQNGAFPDGLTPKVAVIMIGTNNTGHGNGQPSEETAAGVELIVNEVNTRSPKTQIILNAIFPRGSTKEDAKRVRNSEINAIISKLGERDYVHYVDINEQFLDKEESLSKDIMPDYLHPNSKGYEIWKAGILPKIKELIGK